MMNHPARACGTALASSLLVLAGLAAAPPTAQAAGCALRSGNSYTQHTAWVKSVNLACNYVAVRHRYDPVWSNSNFWTSWSGGYVDGYTYYSQRQPDLLYHETQFS